MVWMVQGQEVVEVPQRRHNPRGPKLQRARRIEAVVASPHDSMEDGAGTADTRMVDLIVKNGRVWNGCHDQWRRADILVHRGRVVDVVRAGTMPAGVPRIDVGGAVLTPGLVDAHVHLMLGAESTERLDLSGVRDRSEFEALIESTHAALPEDRWLIATGWNDTIWAGNEVPDTSWLRAAEDRPAVCWRCDWHAVLVNAAVLERLDLSGGSPAGGLLRKAPDGSPSGLLSEAAAWELVMPLVPPLPESVRTEALDRVLDDLLAAGITGVRTMEYWEDVVRHMIPRGDCLPLRVSVVELDRELPLQQREQLSESDRLRITGCKSFFDGTLGSRTARLRQPYSDAPHSRGLWIEHALRNEDQQWCRQVTSLGRAPVIHAIGDEALGRAISLLREVPDAAGATIEHAEVVAAEDLDRMGGLRLSVQPTHRSGDALMAESRLGERAASLLPMRDMLNAGAVLSFGTDWPIVPFDPLRTLRAAITGRDDAGIPFHAEQSISPAEAFRAATINSSEAAGFERGLVPGGPADFVVWDGDPFEDIGTASVRATFVDATLVAGTLPGEKDV